MITNVPTFLASSKHEYKLFPRQHMRMLLISLLFSVVKHTQTHTDTHTDRSRIKPLLNYYSIAQNFLCLYSCEFLQWTHQPQFLYPGSFTSLRASMDPSLCAISAEKNEVATLQLSCLYSHFLPKKLPYFFYNKPEGIWLHLAIALTLLQYTVE